MRFTNDTGPLAAPPHVRRGGLADGQPLRDAREPAGREHHGAARGDRPRPGQGDRRSDAREGQAGRRRVRRHRRARRRFVASSTTRTTSCSTTTRGGRSTSVSRHSFASERRSHRRSLRSKPAATSRGKAGKGGHAADLDDADGRDDDPGGAGYACSALAIASTNQGGTLVGACVFESTVACNVSAVAISSPSRSTRYS